MSETMEEKNIIKKESPAKKPIKKTLEEVRQAEKVKSEIYIGPNLPNCILLQNTVFTKGLPKHLDEHIEKCAAIKELVVPISELMIRKANISQQGTREQVMYEEIIKYIKGGND